MQRVSSARRAQERVNEMIAHLAGLAEERIVLSFAPSTPYYEVLKRIGELFPKGAKVLHRHQLSVAVCWHESPECRTCVKSLSVWSYSLFV